MRQQNFPHLHMKNILKMNAYITGISFLFQEGLMHFKFSIKLFLFFKNVRITSIQLEKLKIIYKAFTITRIINNNLAEGKIHTMK